MFSIIAFRLAVILPLSPRYNETVVCLFNEECNVQIYNWHDHRKR